MQILLRFVQIIYAIYGFVMFIGFMLLIFPFIVFASFFGKITGGNFIYRICTLWAYFFIYILGMWPEYIYECKNNLQKQYVFVFNHISYIDIPLLLIAIKKRHFRVLGKAEMAKIPIFGFVYKNAAVLVDRSSSEKRAKSVKQLKSIIKKGISIVISPEGTFNTTGKPLKEFYDGAFRIAIETQTPIKPMLFLDAYKRYHYSSIFSFTPGKSRIVYLDEVPVDGFTINDVAILKQKVYDIMEQKLIEYKAGWVESSEK